MTEGTYSITQRRFLRGRQVLTLEGNKLKVAYRRGLSLHEYLFDLRGFLPDPLRIRHVPIVTMVALVLLGVLGAVFVPYGIAAEGGVVPGGEEILGLSALGVLLLIFATLGWIPTVKRMANVVLFQGPGGQIVLWADLPNREEFGEFLTLLSTRIKNAQEHEQALLKQLRAAEIINDWEYDQAMEWLRQQEQRPEGM